MSVKDENVLLERALHHHRAGKYKEAAEGYKKVLKNNPKQPDALYLFGCLVYQAGNNGAAVELFRRALAVMPEQAEYHNALGLALTSLDLYAEAEESFERAIASGNQAQFHNNLATLRKKQGQYPQAIKNYKKALELDATLVDAHYNLGNAYRQIGDLTNAVDCFRRALEIDRKHYHALAALGQTLRSANRNAEAAEYLVRALGLNSEDTEILCDFGDVLQDMGKLSEALEQYKSALKLDPQLLRAWYSGGCVQNALHEYVSAIDFFEMAAKLRPDWLEARHNLARALYEMGQVSKAFDHFGQCAASGQSGSDQARAMLAVIVPGVPEANNEQVLRVRQSWVNQDLPPSKPGIVRSGTQLISPVPPLRVGYISSFFHRDNWMKPVWGLINRHDRTEVEVHLFSDAPLSSIRYGYRQHNNDRFIDTTDLSNDEMAAAIRKAEIDVLIDLNGYSNMRRLPLFSLRPAPCVIGWFNMYATTGMKSFDYLIGDDYVIKANEEEFYSEALLRVSGSYLTFEVDYPVPPIADPPCLSSGGIVFGSLASQYKITNEVIKSWSQILLQSPSSSLLLKNKQLANSKSCEFVRNLFLGNGVSSSRLKLEGPANHFEFLESYSRVDIALDTFPYNGGTTTTEAIWQGVPVLAFVGDRWASRTSASILRAGNLGSFVASDVEEYVSLASRLANSPDTSEQLTTLRREMRSKLMESPVCDTSSFAREMEQIYRRCYVDRHQWQDGSAGGKGESELDSKS